MKHDRGATVYLFSEYAAKAKEEITMITRRSFIAAALAVPALPLSFRHGADRQGAGQAGRLSVRADCEEHELRQVNEQVDLGWH